MMKRNQIRFYKNDYIMLFCLTIDATMVIHGGNVIAHVYKDEDEIISTISFTDIFNYKKHRLNFQDYTIEEIQEIGDDDDDYEDDNDYEEYEAYDDE